MASREAESDASIAKKEDYVTMDGLRMVKPYHFNFKCNMKPRWIGRDVVDVFVKEFPGRSREYYQQALKDGRLRVEDNRKNKKWQGGALEDGQCIRHFIHRHEPPALDTLPEVVCVTEDVVAVCKPASLPVHTSGQYKKNTVQALIEVHHPEIGDIYSVHRLDKMVSGLLIFARSPSAATYLQNQMKDRTVQKVYVARVMGEFPKEPVSVDVLLDYEPHLNMASVIEQVEDVSRRPKKDRKRKREAKPSYTEFRRKFIAKDGKTSVVECRPKTGRTHQIRVHLQHLGHPIANDPQYGGEMAKTRPNYNSWRRLGLSRRAGNVSGSDDPPSISDQITTPPPLDKNDPQLTNPGRITNDQCSNDKDATVSAKQDDTQGQQRGNPGVSNELLAPSQVDKKYEHVNTDCEVANDEQDGGIMLSVEKDKDKELLDEHLKSFPCRVDCGMIDEMCMHCPAMVPIGYPIDLEPLWLHAVSYSFGDRKFECGLPEWAHEEWDQS